ncbi:protein SON-like isoform X1 [Sinocyclocheilus grahami]|uniref:protein SON-like isoform X1 n=1 Tax=Sinocyclocheilus grahami TaxID=75366 RepID=UPI0007AC7136|nr:PREDICTED: protein SON-like isoform X1 [Sinocyclocheilus grahami]
MATNIEQIFRDFVMNKIKEIEDESQENSVKDEPQSDPVTETREDGLKEEKMNTPTDKVIQTDLQDNHGKEDTSTKHRKSKKHKKHKSKKKRKKRKEGKDSSSDTESDKEIQEHSGKKKKRKKKKKSKDADKAKRSGSRSESSSASGSESESESKPPNENTKSSSADKTSKSEFKNTSGVGKPQELPDIIPKMENSVHKSTEKERTKEKKRSSSRTSKSKESSRGRRTRSRSPRRKSERRSRSPKPKRQSKSTSRTRNSSRKRSHQQRERSRSRSKRHNNRSRSHSVRRGKHSRSRSHSRRTRSRSVVISRKNRRSTSKCRSRSPRHRRHSRSKSRSRTKPSKSRSISKSRSDLKLETESIKINIDPAVDNSKSCETQTNVSQNTTENGKDPTVAVISDTKLSETASNISNSGFSAVSVKGSWRPIPFLAVPSETMSSQKCVTPEVPLEVTNLSEEPSTFSTVTPKDSECAASPEKKETNANPTTSGETSVVKNSMSPSRSPSQKISSRSKVAARSRSKSSSKKRKSRSSSRKSRSPSGRKSHKSRTRSKRSKSRSPKNKRSRSRSQSRWRKSRTPDRNRRSKSRKRSGSRSRRRSRSGSRWRRGFGSRTLNQRDRWKREPSRSPVLILRKKRSASGTQRSTSKTPPRLTELDKEQLLEIAKANAAAMCAKAGVPIPESLRPKAILQIALPTPNSTSLSLSLPMMSNMTMNAAMASMTAATMTAALSSMGALASLPQMAPLPTIVNKPPSSTTQNLASIEEAKKKVTKQANSFSIKELTERCKKIAESKEEMAIAKPHVSDDEEDERLFGASLKENKGIAFSLGNTSVKSSVRTETVFAKEFPVSSGSQHRKKEADGAYGEWVPVEKKTEKPSASGSSGTEETSKDNDSVFPEAPSQPVDITLAVSERAVAQKKLAENPFDINAMCMLNRAQEQVDAWAQSNTIPGLFTGSTGAQVLSSDELSNSGPQAWIKKDQFLRAAPVSGGMGELLMRKMGWHSGEGLGKHREGTVEPIIIDFKTDRKGLVAEGEKTQKSGNIVVMKDLLGKHPVSALMEMCNKKKWPQPEFVLVHHSGPDHRKNFLFKVCA